MNIPLTPIPLYHPLNHINSNDLSENKGWEQPMTEQQFLSSIRSEFPELIWHKHRYIDHGWDHYVVIMDDSMVFRAPKQAAAIPKFLDEIHLLAHLRHRVPVGLPDYTHIAADGSFAGYAILPGALLTRDAFQHLNPADQTEIAAQLAGFLTTLHGIPESELTPYNIERFDANTRHQQLEQDAQTHIFAKLSPSERQWVRDLFAGLRDAHRQDKQLALIHSDLREGHIFWDADQRRISIIDFGDRCIWDTAKDFTGLLAFGSDFCAQVYGMYQGVKDDAQLQRAKLYYDRVAILLMVDSQMGYPISFADAYDFLLHCMNKQG